MADSSSSSVNRNTIYDYRGDGVVTTIPIQSTAMGGHGIQQGVNQGIGVPTQSFFSDNASSGIASTETVTGQAAKSYPDLAAPFGRASTTLFTVGVLNDSVNVTQHLLANRYREATIEFGGALGQNAGALSGAALTNALLQGIPYPVFRIGSAAVGSFLGAYNLGEIGKDAVRHFTTPSLPDDLDLKPNVVINGQGYAAVRVEGKVIWHQIHPPEPQDDVAANSDVPGTEPNTSETYTAVTSISQATQLTDRFLQQHLPPVDYERYRQDMAVLRQPQ